MKLLKAWNGSTWRFRAHGTVPEYKQRCQFSVTAATIVDAIHRQGPLYFVA